MSRRLPTGVLVAVSLVFWTSAPPARAANPPALSWTNYLGSDKEDSFGDIVRDPVTGNVFITGTLPPESSNRGILTARFSGEGTWMAWSTLSGDVLDGSRAIALGKDGLFIAGYSRSKDFGKDGLLSDVTRGEQDGLVALLNPQDLTVRGIYLMDFDKRAEVINDMVVMQDGSVVVVGTTALHASDLDSDATNLDVFVARLKFSVDGPGKPTVTELWSKQLSKGSDADVALAVALDADETVYLAGKTKSADLFDEKSRGLPYTDGGTFDGFIMKREKSDGVFIAGTYFGGQGQDSVNGLALQDKTIFVAGTSSSLQLPNGTNSLGVFSRAFAASFEQGTMKHLNTLTLGRGQTANDEGRALAFVGEQLYMGGIVGSQDFPGMGLTTPFRPYKGFVAKIDLSEAGPSPSTPSIVGGNRDDMVIGLSGAAFDGGTVLFVGGNTTSTNLSPSGPPVPPNYSSQYMGQRDMFIGQVNFNAPPSMPGGGNPGGGNPGNPDGPPNGGGSTDGEPGGSDGGPGPLSPLGFACGASGGGPGAMALVSLLGLALLAAARRDRSPPRG